MGPICILIQLENEVIFHVQVVTKKYSLLIQMHKKYILPSYKRYNEE